MKINGYAFIILRMPIAVLCFLLFGNSLVNSDAIGGTVIQTAPVVVDGRVLFQVVGVPNYPAKKRAEEIAQRIEALARNATFDPETIQVREVDGVMRIVADGEVVMGVLLEDVQALGITSTAPQVIARELYLKKVVQAIKAYRQEREPRTLLANGLQALLRTAILIFLLFIVIKVFNKLRQWLDRRFKIKVENLEAKSQRLFDSRQIWSGLMVGLRAARTLLVLVLVYVFINFVLSLFPWTRSAGQLLLGYMLNPLRYMVQAVLDYLPNLFFLVLLFFLVRYLIKMTRSFFSGIEGGRIRLPGFETEWALPTYRIARLIIILLALVISYPYIPGAHSEAFKGLSLLIGVLLSLGSTSLISNLLAGYTMTYRRAFKIGDRVKIGDHVGEITLVRLLVTHLRSMKNEEIVIPNSLILNGDIVNYSSMAASRGLILHTTVGIGYEVPWRQVEAMLLMAAGQTPGLLKEPPPFILQTALGDFSVTYELNVFCSQPEKMASLYTDLHRNIQDVFNEYNIQIMTPHYEMDTEAPKIVPKEKWHSAPAAAQPESDAGAGPGQADS